MTGRTPRYQLLILLTLILLCLCCDDNEDDYYDYLDSSYIDTVLMGDTVSVEEDVSVVHVYPYGCNSFERLDCKVTGDTLLLDAIYRFKFEGEPCVHGSGLDTTQHLLCFEGPESYIVKYRRDENITVYQPVINN